MAIPDFDPRTGGACSNFMAKKFFSIVTGWLFLVIWVLGLLTLIFKPSSVTMVVKNSTTTTIVLAAFLILICIGFSVVLLLGLHKDRPSFIKTYLIFSAVYLILLIMSFFINLFLQPENLGFRGFFSMVFNFFIALVAFFVVRSYYLLTYCNGSSYQRNSQQKV